MFLAATPAMRVLLFDTETNGLPKSWRATPYNTANWPIIISLAWQIWEITPSSAAFVEKGSYLVKPPADVVWNEESQGIHGITQADASTNGLPAAEVFPAFVSIVRTVNLIVAHNMSFDKTVLLSELIRLNPRLAMDWWPRFEYCTCESTKTLCRLPSQQKKPNPKDPYKRAKLVELFNYLFPSKSTDGFAFHTADGDVQCLVECFLELVRRGHLPLAIWERSLRV